MNRLFYNNGAKWRLLRTIIQGIIGVFVANLDLIIGSFSIPAEYKPMIAAVVMAILSPIMAELGTSEMDKPELPEDYYEGENHDGE